MATDGREAWLKTLARWMVPVLERRAGVEIPAYRITCGFPSRGGELGRKTRVRGQAWSAEASGDSHAEIFVSPVEDDAPTIAAIVAHELLHTALPDAGHGRRFQLAAEKIGHTKPFTTSEPTPAFMAWAAPILAKLPAYPHARLNAMRGTLAKKQTTRMLKCYCAECGYTVRTSAKWLEEAGPPRCAHATHGVMECEEFVPADPDDGLLPPDDGHDPGPWDGQRLV